MPVAIQRFFVQFVHFISTMRLWIKRRLIGRKLVYFTMISALILFVTVQFTYGRPSQDEDFPSAKDSMYSDVKNLPDNYRVKENSQPKFNNEPMRGDQQFRQDFSVNERKTVNNPPKNIFVLNRKVVHLDLKGGAYRPQFFPKLFDFFKKIGFTGILLEWEDMFPYTGRLASALNGDHYTMENVKSILQAAKDRNLEVIPLVQTFGHLEWVLKLPEFAEMREDPHYPQAICFGRQESFDLVKDMIDQVATVHQQYGMPFFHMGADEVFQIGACQESKDQIQQQGSRDRAMIWYMAKVAQHIKQTHKTIVLAWHDMFTHVLPQDIADYKIHTLLEPMLWSYAEDLNQYLPYSTWLSLKPFGNVWGASAFKGADGPLRYVSNPLHYIRNHESWIQQFNFAYRDFNEVRGLVFTGWSRYDHMAIMCELVPTALPQLAMSMETMLELKPLKSYPKTKEWLGCTPTTELAGVSFGCNFPGSQIYEIINNYWNDKAQIEKYLDEDFDLNGWTNKIAKEYKMSSPMYAEKILTAIGYHIDVVKRHETRLREAMAPIYYQETIDEYAYTYMSTLLDRLLERKATAERIMITKTFPKRPFIKYPQVQ